MTQGARPANVKVKVRCEGCRSSFTGLRRRNARNVVMGSIAPGWCQSGRSRKNPGMYASWCPSCREREAYIEHANPSAREVQMLIAKAEGK